MLIAEYHTVRLVCDVREMNTIKQFVASTSPDISSSRLLTLKALPRQWVALETANLQSWSSAKSIAWGGPLPTSSFDITSIRVMNNNGLSAEP